MKKFKFIIFFSVLLAFYGCGGGGSDNTSNTEVKAYFIDSPVKGLKYEINGKVNYTGDNGEFSCYPGDNVQFIIGSTKIGNSIKCAQGYITPADLFDVNSDDISVNHELANTLVLIQSLDSDNNPQNGVDINKVEDDKLSYLNIDLNNYDSVAGAVKDLNKKPLSQTEAVNNFTDTLYALKTGKYSEDDLFYLQFVKNKIDLLASYSDGNLTETNDTLSKIISFYSDYVKQINTYDEYIKNITDKNIFTSDVLDKNLSLRVKNELDELVLTELFNVDENNLEKLAEYMQSGVLESGIEINGVGIDADTVTFLRDLNVSLYDSKNNIGNITSLQNYYNGNLNGSEYALAEKYLDYYYIAGDETDLINGINKFYDVNLSNADDVLNFLAAKFGYSGVDVLKVNDFIQRFISENKTFFDIYKIFKEDYKNITGNINTIMDKKEYFFTDNKGIPSTDLTDIIVNATKYSFSISGENAPYSEFIYKNNIIEPSQIKQFYENIINFDVFEGHIYALGSYGDLYLDGKQVLQEKSAQSVKVSDNYVYILKHDGEIDVYDKNSFKKLYTLSNRSVYNKITVKNNVVFALRTDGKVDIYQGDSLIKTLSDPNDLIYINMWISDKYAVFATNDGNIAIYSLDDVSNPQFVGYYKINPYFAAIGGNKFFVFKDNSIYMIDLDNKETVSKFDIENIKKYLSDCFSSSEYVLYFDKDKGLLFAYNGGDILEFKLDGNTLAFTNYIHIVSGGWDVSEFFNKEILEKEGKIYTTLYGSVVELNIPSKPLLDIVSKSVNEPLSDVNTTDRYGISGMTQKFNSLVSEIKTVKGKYVSYVFIPVTNGINSGVYIMQPYKGIIGYLNISNEVLMPDINNIYASENGYIVSTNGNVVNIYKLNDENGEIDYFRKFIYPYVNDWNYEENEIKPFDGLMAPVANILMKAVISNNQLAMVSTNMLQVLRYNLDTNITQVASVYSDVLGNVPYKMFTDNNGTLFVTNSCATPYGCINGGGGTVEFKNFFSADTVLDEDYQSNIKILPTVFKVIGNYVFTDSFDSQGSVFNLNGDLVKNIDLNYSDVENEGGYYLFLDQNKTYILNNSFDLADTVDLNASGENLKILSTGVYLINDSNISKLNIDRSMDIDVNYTQRGYNSYNNYYVDMNESNLNDIAEINIKSKYPYSVKLTEGNETFELVDGILKVRDGADLSKTAYNVALTAQNVFGGEESVTITVYNTDMFTPENASKTYSLSTSYLEHDVLPLNNVSLSLIKFPVLRGEDADYFKISGNSVYFKQPPSISNKGTYDFDIVGLYNGVLTDIKETVTLIDTNDNYVFTEDTITDTENNLTWQRSPAAQPVYKYDDAKSICENSTTGGYTDWRLPTADELNTIYDSNNHLQEGFNYSGPPTTWSQTTCDNGVEMFDFTDGSLHCWSLDQSDMDPKPDDDVRCVRDSN